MTTEEINERFSELAGICWHEYDPEIGCGVNRSFCTDCNADPSCSNFKNPDYCADPRLVLEVMMKLEYWGENWGVTIGSMLDKTGKIALEAIKWIEENT